MQSGRSWSALRRLCIGTWKKPPIYLTERVALKPASNRIDSTQCYVDHSMFLIEDLRGEVEVTAFSRAVRKHQSGSMFQTRWAFSGTIYPVPVFHVNTDETWEAIILEIRSIRRT